MGRPARLLVSLVVLAMLGVGAFASEVMAVTSFDKGATVNPDFSIKCPLSHRRPDDPIVAPRRPGGSHMHDFFGNRSTNAFSTYATLTGKPTTCVTDMRDMASYWTPTMYVNGQPARIKSGFAVYKAHAESVRAKVRPFPKDFRMIAGNSKAATPGANPLIAKGKVGWNCYGKQRGFTTSPLGNCRDLGGAFQDLYIVFPACWDGSRIAAANQSHVAYFDPKTKLCPRSHPAVLPQLVLWVRYQEFNARAARFSSGGFHTVHADFLNVWHQPRLADLTLRCIVRNQTRAQGCPSASV